MSARLIPKDKDYPKLSKATSGYVENPYLEKSDLKRGYFCYDCLYFINGNDCAIVRKDGPDEWTSKWNNCCTWIVYSLDAR